MPWSKDCFENSGKAFLIRYADDHVACFEQEQDARAFLQAMTERLGQLDLEVAPQKTALLRFASQALGLSREQYQGPRTFSFLGFTHYADRSRQGRFVLGRKSDGKHVSKKLKKRRRIKIGWHRREARRQTESTNSGLHVDKSPAYSQTLYLPI